MEMPLFTLYQCLHLVVSANKASEILSGELTIFGNLLLFFWGHIKIYLYPLKLKIVKTFYHQRHVIYGVIPLDVWLKYFCFKERV